MATLKIVPDLNNVENCSVYLNDVLMTKEHNYQAPAMVEYDDVIVLRVEADEGFMFDEEFQGSLTYEDEWLNQRIENFSITSDGWNSTFTILEVDTNMVQAGLSSYTNMVYFNFKAVEGSSIVPPIDTVNKFAGLYNPSPDELQEISELKYREFGEYGELIDLGSYITNLYVLPFSLDEIVAETKKNIKMGGYELDLEVNVLTSSKVGVDIALIEVPATYNNAYDYLNTVCRIYLPYLPHIELEPNKVIDKTITVNYIVELYTGELTANIYSNNVLIESHSRNIVQEIPFKQKTQELAYSYVGSVIQNNVVVPFIEVERNIPYNKVEGIGRSFSQVEVIGNLEGYVEIEKVQLETSATMREQEQIISKLSNGVVIK